MNLSIGISNLYKSLSAEFELKFGHFNLNSFQQETLFSLFAKPSYLIVRLLHDKGVFFNFEKSNNTFILREPLTSLHFDFIKELISLGANVNEICQVSEGYFVNPLNEAYDHKRMVLSNTEYQISEVICTYLKSKGGQYLTDKILDEIRELKTFPQFLNEENIDDFFYPNWVLSSLEDQQILGESNLISDIDLELALGEYVTFYQNTVTYFITSFIDEIKDCIENNLPTKSILYRLFDERNLILATMLSCSQNWTREELFKYLIQTKNIYSLLSHLNNEKYQQKIQRSGELRQRSFEMKDRLYLFAQDLGAKASFENEEKQIWDAILYLLETGKTHERF